MFPFIPRKPTFLKMLKGMVAEKLHEQHGIKISKETLSQWMIEELTELQPTRIMTDAGAYSDIVFGLFRLLVLRFSPN